ncbi:hypothetical protein PGT21_003737 [Puccinia graminis f. sp. tritici]|uniref:Uncharacterized protein n=1 Tax=Puccinia graminis f. sp. tritici TaxID=56615 RepID=A0A5B0MW41_PUCGR|nr:hypothetical protein PGT21_003737 [Puccinia graminis f. sp. tritici]KAA1120386.1 hypothetical protein PGTUg99_007669 [Puccinia graminis f. sp. tritici]
MRSNHQPGSHNSMILDRKLTWLRSWLSPLTAIREFELLSQIPNKFLGQTSPNQVTKKAAYLGFAAAHFRRTQNQLRPEITNLNLDTSPPHYRRVIVWSPLTIGIFPLIVSGSPIIQSVSPSGPLPPLLYFLRSRKTKRVVDNEEPTHFPVWTPSFTPLDPEKKQLEKKTTGAAPSPFVFSSINLPLLSDHPMGSHLRNGSSISVEQQQHDQDLREQTQRNFRPQHPDAGARIVGLQRGNNLQYQLSPAATERLQKLRHQSAVTQQDRYESTGGRSYSVGARSLAGLNQLQRNSARFRKDFEQISTSAASNTALNLCDQYKYRNKPSDFISKSVSSKSEVSPSSGEQGEPHHRQPPAKDCDQPSLNPTSLLAHSQTITSSSAFNTPCVRHNLAGFWPTTVANPETPYGLEPAPKQPSSIGARYPVASTPAMVYSNPPSFRVLQPTERTTGNFKYISDQISEINISENNRFEQLKRRLGDVCQTTYAVSNKLNSIIEPQDRDSPPHLKFNNPILNIQDEPSQKPFLKEKDVPQEQQYPVQHVTSKPKVVNKNDNTSRRSSPKTETTSPNWVDEFPFIDHGDVNSDVRNQLWKAIPKTSEWEQFSD